MAKRKQDPADPIGRAVVAVREATAAEMAAVGLYEPDAQPPVVVVLDGGLVLLPLQDAEANGPGHLVALAADGKAYNLETTL